MPVPRTGDHGVNDVHDCIVEVVLRVVVDGDPGLVDRLEEARGFPPAKDPCEIVAAAEHRPRLHLAASGSEGFDACRQLVLGAFAEDGDSAEDERSLHRPRIRYRAVPVRDGAAVLRFIVVDAPGLLANFNAGEGRHHLREPRGIFVKRRHLPPLPFRFPTQVTTPSGKQRGRGSRPSFAAPRLEGRSV